MEHLSTNQIEERSNFAFFGAQPRFRIRGNLRW
jgi:hypothetical protein